VNVVVDVVFVFCFFVFSFLWVVWNVGGVGGVLKVCCRVTPFWRIVDKTNQVSARSYWHMSESNQPSFS